MKVDFAPLSMPTNILSLRPATDADQEFLVGVFASTRADELQALAWNPIQAEMFINIQQRNFSFRAEYDIETPACIYFAQKKSFSLRSQIGVFATSGEQIVRIVGSLGLFRANYHFDFADGRFYEFFSEKIWNRVFVCENSKESYKLYGHQGFDYSIFRNDTQIAAFTRNSIKIGAGDQYDVRLNDDVDKFLVICMVLVMDDTENADTNSMMTYEVGQIGPEEKAFDSRWQPN